MSTIIEGKYTSATVYRDDIEQYAEAQIKMLCDMKIHEGCTIRLMPDVHPGKVGPIGLAMEMPYNSNTCFMPALVGNDIGCGVSCTKIKLPKRQKKIDFNKLTKVIDNTISNAKKKNMASFRSIEGFYGMDEVCTVFDELRYYGTNTIGTLGGGNHFVEIDTHDGDLYFIVHTGSRSVGNYVYGKYMEKAKENSPNDIPYELSYISGDDLKHYLTYVSFVAKFATFNRRTLIERICSDMDWTYSNDIIDTIHNYVYLEDNKLVLTKGANCLKGNALVCIPVNSVDGCIIGKTKDIPGNIYLPHGSGRIIKRVEVSDNYTVNGYKKLMNFANVYCNDYKDTLDEYPFAYRRYFDLDFNDYIDQTIRMKSYTKPIYNYRSKGEK